MVVDSADDTTVEMAQNITVSTPSGRLRGLFLKSTEGDDYYSFKGIPYAKPPIGDLRFQVSFQNFFRTSSSDVTISFFIQHENSSFLFFFLFLFICII